MKSFNEIFEDKTKYGTKVKTDEYHESGAHIIIDQGQSQIAGYTDLEEGLFQDVPAIIFGDHTRVVKYIEEPFFLGADGVKVLKSKLPDANYKYLYYALRNAKIPNTGYNRHFKWVKELQFKYPGVDEQAYIVETLDKVEKIILTRQEELQTLDELIKARFVEMFGDYHTNSKGFESHKGSELFKFASGKFLPEEKRLGEGIPVYGGNGIAWYTDEPLIEYPTIIIGRVGALCGNIHSVREPVWITDNAIYIKEHKTEKFTLEFLTEMMTIMDFYQYADFSGQPKITQKPLESLHYLTPPIEMQNEFTEFCKQVDKSKVAIQKSLDETQMLFDSLMQQYFG